MRFHIAITALSILLLACQEDKQKPVVDFTFNNFQTGPAEIQFSNQTTFASDYYWSFGDGINSKSENPSHLYRKPGSYKVTLRASNEDGTSTLEKTISIHGTTIEVLNHSSYPLYNIALLYDSTIMGINHTIVDGLFIDSVIGNANPGEYSSYKYTEYEKVYIAFQTSPQDKGFFLLSDPFLLTKNRVNIFQAHDYMSGYYVEP